jgi:hypothetical protein
MAARIGAGGAAAFGGALAVVADDWACAAPAAMATANPAAIAKRDCINSTLTFKHEAKRHCPPMAPRNQAATGLSALLPQEHIARHWFGKQAGQKTKPG